MSAHAVSHGFSLWLLRQECALRFDMPPAITLKVAQDLFEASAISYPRTIDRYIPHCHHKDGAETLAVIGSISADLKAFVQKTVPSYHSDVWRNDVDPRDDFGAIRPLPTVKYEELTDDQKNVFGVIADRYIALFDPSRSSPLGSTDVVPEPEVRRFVAHRHRTVEDFFGEKTDIFGPDFYVDHRHESLFLAVEDNVTDAAWLEVPLGVFPEYMARLPFATPADFARANMAFLRRFVDEANNTVLSEGRGLYVCAPDTYEIRNGQRHYLWPRQ